MMPFSDPYLTTFSTDYDAPPFATQLWNALRVLHEYVATYRDPARVHGICEEYRAAATIDVEHVLRQLSHPSRAGLRAML
jgi:hypothetical protein